VIPFNIEEIKSSLGETQTTPAELFKDDDGRIATKTGISQLNRTSRSALELGVDAVKKLEILEEVKDKVNFLIYVTQSATYYLPNHASRIQDECGISKKAMCFDINQGCSGFVQALYMMNSLLSNSGDLGLIVCSDTYSHHLSPDDRATQVLFSDGATATLVSTQKAWEIISAEHLTDGSGADLLSKKVDTQHQLSMDGAAVFQWTRRELGKQIELALSSCNVSLEDVDKFYLHQASKLVINNVIKSLGIEAQKVPLTLGITGNLVSSSIPFLLESTLKDFEESKLIVMSGFGVGLSSSSCVLRRITS